MARSDNDANEKMAAHWMERIGGPDFVGSSSSVRDQPASNSGSILDRTESFVEVMRAYQGVFDLPVDFDIAKAHSWEEVLETAQKAEEKYFAEAGRVRKFARNIGDYAAGIKPWMTMLPTDSYMSIASGSLKVLLAAAARRSEQREKILLAVRKVPETLSQLEECQGHFRSDKLLREHAMHVYNALLDMIEGLITSLVSESLPSKMKFGARGERNKSAIRHSKSKLSVEQCIAHCEAEIREFNSRVEALTRAKIVQTNTFSTEILCTTKDIQNQTNITNVQIHEIGAGVEDIKEAHTGMMTNQEEMFAYMKEILQDVMSNNDWMKVAEERRTEVERLREQTQTLELERQRQNLELRHVRSLTANGSANAAAKSWLLNILEISPESPAKEAQSILRHGGALDSSSNSCVKELFHQIRFQSWLRSGFADSLLVEECVQSHGIERCTPLSMACALLTETLPQLPQAVVIHFFCGAHNSPRSKSPTGGSGLIRSLLTQILCMQAFDLSFMDSQQIQERIERHDLAQLCDLFRNLMSQLGASVAFCLIDGISLFEGQQWRHDACYVISVLQQVIQESGSGSKLKLLVTGPRTSKYMKQFFASSNSIRLRGQSEESDSVAASRALRMEIGRSNVAWSNEGHVAQ